MSSKNLTEDLGAHSEMIVQVKVLEEGLSIKAVLAHYLGETLANSLDNGLLFSCCLAAIILSRSPGIVEADVYGFFELFLCKNLINVIAESFPAHVLTFFGGLKVSSQQFKFAIGDLNLA